MQGPRLLMSSSGPFVQLWLLLAQGPAGRGTLESHTLRGSRCSRCGDDVKVHAALGQADGRDVATRPRGLGRDRTRGFQKGLRWTSHVHDGRRRAGTVLVYCLPPGRYVEVATLRGTGMECEGGCVMAMEDEEGGGRREAKQKRPLMQVTRELADCRLDPGFFAMSRTSRIWLAALTVLGTKLPSCKYRSYYVLGATYVVNKPCTLMLCPQCKPLRAVTSQLPALVASAPSV